MRALILYLSLLFLLSLATAAQAAVVKGVQSGTAVSNANGVLSVAVSPVDPAKSFLVFNLRSDSGRPPDSMLRGRLNAAGSALEFERVTSGGARIDIQWYLVEFSSGVRVQRGEFRQTARTMNIPIAPVASTAQAFVLWSKTPAATHSQWSLDDPILGELTARGNLQFRVNEANTHEVAWQVVEFTTAADLQVQKGSTSLASSQASVDVTLPTPVDVNTSFVLAGFRSSGGGSDVGARMIRARLLDANTVRIDRSRTGDTLDEISWQVVELKDGSRVQHGNAAFAAGTARVTAALSSLDLAHSLAFASVQAAAGQSLGRTRFNSDDIIGEASATLSLTSSSLTLRRNAAADAADIGWFVVDFNAAPAVALPAPVAEWRLDETRWDGTPGEVVDSSGNGLNGVRVGGATPAPAKVCNGASLNGSSDYLQIADDPLLDITDRLTVTTWIRADSLPSSGLKSILSKDENYEFHVNSRGEIFWWWNNAAGGTRTLTSSGVTIIPGRWYHIAIVYDAGGRQRLYVDGAVRASASYSETLRINNDPLQIGADQGFPGRQFDGLIDEVRVYHAALDASQVAAVMAETRPCAVSRLAYYPLDEAAWNGTPGEIQDASGSGHHGRAIGGAQSVANGKVCRAGQVLAEGDAIDTGVDLDADAGAVGSISFWFRPNWTDNGGERSRARVLFDATRGDKYFKLTKRRAARGRDTRLSLLFEDDADNDFDVSADVARLTSGTWVHIAVTWDFAANRYQIYLNGAPVADVSRASNRRMPDLNSLYFGDNRTGYNPYGITRVANGSFDEIHLDARVLSQAEIQADMNATHPCGGATHFVLGHDGFGINCVAESITLEARLADGSLDTGYTGTVTLDTQNGNGSWSLAAGSGVFSDVLAGDGQASYQFVAADGGTARFLLDYPSGPASVNIAAGDGSITDDDSEGLLRFSPNGFVVTQAPLGNPPPPVIDTRIAPQTASTPFALYLAAYGQTPSDPVCGIIEAYDGAKALRFWSAYADPVSGSRPLQVDGVAVAGLEAAAAAQTVNFSQGQATVSVNYADVGRLNLGLKDDTVTDPNLPNGIRGAADPFVVRPAGFVLGAIQRSSDGLANPAATDQNGPVFIAAGSPFSVTVTAVDSLGNATPNFGQETTPETVRLDPGLVAAGGVNNPPIVFTAGFGPFVGGVATGSDFSWGEVGIIRLTPAIGDGDYLGAGDVLGTPSGNVGRFIPFDFDVSLDNSPRFATSCGGFTYLGQAFGYATAPQVTLTARNAAGGTTANYDNAWWKLADFSESYAHNGAISSGAALDASGAGHTPLVCSNCAGSVGVSFNGSLAYTAAQPETRPFDGAVDITFAVTDADGVAYAGNPFTIPAIGFDAGAEQRAGRGYARDAYGTYAQIGDVLPLEVGTQYYDASGRWVDNTDDSCTMFSYTKVDSGIVTTVTPASPVGISAGRGDLSLQLGADPGDPGGSASVGLTWPSWLTGDASATVTFGIFRGDDRFLYWREAP